MAMTGSLLQRGSARMRHAGAHGSVSRRAAASGRGAGGVSGDGGVSSAGDGVGGVGGVGASDLVALLRPLPEPPGLRPRVPPVRITRSGVCGAGWAASSRHESLRWPWRICWTSADMSMVRSKPGSLSPSFATTPSMMAFRSSSFSAARAFRSSSFCAARLFFMRSAFSFLSRGMFLRPHTAHHAQVVRARAQVVQCARVIRTRAQYTVRA